MPGPQRTTIALEPDVAAAIAQRQRAGSTGISRVVNDLLRRALTEKPAVEPFVQETSPMGALVDLHNVHEVLDAVEGPWRR